MSEPKPPEAATWVPAASDPQKLREWARARKLEVKGIHGTMTIKNSLPSMDEVGLLAEKLNALEWANDSDKVRTTLVDQLKGPLYSAWLYYLEEQGRAGSGP